MSSLSLPLPLTPTACLALTPSSLPLPFASLCSCLAFSAASTCSNCLLLCRGSCVWRTRGQSRVACGTLVPVSLDSLGATAGAALSPSLSHSLPRLANCALMQSKQIEADRRGGEDETEAATLPHIDCCHPLRRWPCAPGAPATRAAN